MKNGDGETGPCATSGVVVPPTMWSYNGSVTQIAYMNLGYTAFDLNTPGPRYSTEIIIFSYSYYTLVVLSC